MHELTHASRKVFLKFMLSIENTKLQCFQGSCSPSKIQKCSISKGHAIHRKYKSAVFLKVMLSIENTKVYMRYLSMLIAMFIYYYTATICNYWNHKAVGRADGRLVCLLNCGAQTTSTVSSHLYESCCT